uniref:Tail fiber protein n=1 Tax=Caulobacter phage BL57 TaxID=3348355 RepID=A0AB74UM75_9VIRU
MCVVSAVMDYGRREWPDLLGPGGPTIVPGDQPWFEIISPGLPPRPVYPKPKVPTRAEIEAFRRLVKAAQEFDEQTGQPHCEDPEKIKLLDAINRLAERLDAIEQRLAAQDSAAAEDAAAIAASVKS